MYYLIWLMYFTPANATNVRPPLWSDNRILVATKAECEQRRDALLNGPAGVAGKPSGPTPNPYVTDAWCFEKADFDKTNAGGKPIERP